MSEQEYPEDREKAPDDPMIGKMVGKVRIQSTLGVGGMGKVYAGFDEKLERRVALKRIRHGHAENREMRARFLQEARLLSRLRHPNICQIYDYVEAADDSDYLVLERIEGRTLKEIEPEELSLEEKLKIAQELAEALAVAHDAGIVHRDLKPANVMLTSAGTPKILDFGIAQSTVDEDVAAAAGTGTSFQGRLSEDQPTHLLTRESAAREPTVEDLAAKDLTAKDLTAKDLAAAKPASEVGADGKTRVLADGENQHPTRPLGASTVPADLRFRTLTGAVIGTPQYMSPEQARGERPGPAADMYSLGLLLHEFLTGSPPYPDDLSMLQLMDAVQRGRTEPVVGLDAETTQLVERLCSAAPGSRPSAPDTAEALRRIRRTPMRRRMKRLRRAGVALSLLIALVMTFQALRIREEAERARAAADLADKEAQTTREVLDFFLSLFESANPWESRDGREQHRDLTVSEALDRGLERIDGRLEHRPRIRARVLESVGSTHAHLGDYEVAEPLLEEALELQRNLDGGSFASGRLLVRLGDLAMARGDFPTSEKRFQKAVELLQDRANPVDGKPLAEAHLRLGVLYAEQGRFPQADEALETALSLFSGLEEESPGWVARTLGELATVSEQRGDLADAEQRLRQVIESMDEEWGEHNPHMADIYNRLGVVLDQQEDVDGAVEAYGRAIEIADKTLGPEHPVPAVMRMNLGSAYRKQQHFEEAEALYRQSRDHIEQAHGAEHPRLGELYGNWGLLQADRGRFGEARESLERARTIFESAFGTEHPSIAMCDGTIGNTYLRQRRLGEAETALSRSLARFESLFGPDHPATWNGRHGLARVLLEQGRLDEARELWDSLPAIQNPSDLVPLGPRDIQKLLFRAELDRLAGDRTAARERLEQVRPVLSDPDPVPSNRENLLRQALFLRIEGNLERDEGHPEQALALYEQARKKTSGARPDEHPDWIPLLVEEAETLERIGRTAEAAAVRQRLRTLAERFEVRTD